MELCKVYKMMSGIKPGDEIFFNSYGACNNTTQQCRSVNSAIPATGTVLKVYPRYVLVKLKEARECVMWDSIAKVNGISWPLYNENCGGNRK
mgnify:FL=1